MKKWIAMCLAGAMTIATCGLAACGENGGGSGTFPGNPETFVSEKIETDEQWDKAMRDTFTYLFDFEGEEDPTITYEEFPYWHTYAYDTFDDDLKLAQDRNFKADLFLDGTVSEEEYERWNCSFVYDMGKYHSSYEYAGEYYEENSLQKSATKFEEYLKYSEMGELLHVGKLTVDEGTDEHEDPLNVWSSDLHVGSTECLEVIAPFFNYSHFGLLKEQGAPYFEEHSSILEYAKYDEKRGGYVITDKELSEQMEDGFFSAEDGMTYIFKFKDGMLVAAWMEWADEAITMKAGFTITYGGQKVTFPNNLPW